MKNNNIRFKLITSGPRTEDASWADIEETLPCLQEDDALFKIEIYSRTDQKKIFHFVHNWGQRLFCTVAVYT